MNQELSRLRAAERRRKIAAQMREGRTLHDADPGVFRRLTRTELEREDVFDRQSGLRDGGDGGS